MTKRVLSVLETIQLSRFMEEHALTPDRKAYKEGWDDEQVAQKFSGQLTTDTEPINQYHVRGMRIKVYGFNIASYKKTNALTMEVLKVLSEVPFLDTTMNYQDAFNLFRVQFNRWAVRLKGVCTPKEK